MGERDKSRHNRSLFRGGILKNYDGEGSDSDIFEESPDARKQFVDRVMEEIGDNVSPQVIADEKTEKPINGATNDTPSHPDK